MFRIRWRELPYPTPTIGPLLFFLQPPFHVPVFTLGTAAVLDLFISSCSAFVVCARFSSVHLRFVVSPGAPPPSFDFLERVAASSSSSSPNEPLPSTHEFYVDRGDQPISGNWLETRAKVQYSKV